MRSHVPYHIFIHTHHHYHHHHHWSKEQDIKKNFSINFGESWERRERPFVSLLEVSKGGGLTQLPSWSQKNRRKPMWGRRWRWAALSPDIVWCGKDFNGPISPSGKSQHAALEVSHEGGNSRRITPRGNAVCMVRANRKHGSFHSQGAFWRQHHLLTKPRVWITWVTDLNRVACTQPSCMEPLATTLQACTQSKRTRCLLPPNTEPSPQTPPTTHSQGLSQNW